MSVGGPWLGLLVTLKQWDKDRSRGFLSAAIVPVMGYTVTMFIAKGSYAQTGLMPCMAVTAGTLVGTLLGYRTGNNLTDTTFRRLIMAIAVIAGCVVLLNGMYLLWYS